MLGNVYPINWILVNWYKSFFFFFCHKSVCGGVLNSKIFTLLLLDLIYDIQIEKKYIDQLLPIASRPYINDDLIGGKHV